MNGSKKENSDLAESIKAASSPPSSGTAAPEKSPAASGSTPSNASPFASKLRLEAILPLLKVEQGNLTGWIAVGGLTTTSDLLAIEANDVSAVLWISSTNKLHLSTRSNGLVVLDCNGISCPVPSWQRRLVLGLLLGLIDWLPPAVRGLAQLSLKKNSSPPSTQKTKGTLMAIEATSPHQPAPADLVNSLAKVGLSGDKYKKLVERLDEADDLIRDMKSKTITKSTPDTDTEVSQ
jgi:hypothetical protein